MMLMMMMMMMMWSVMKQSDCCLLSILTAVNSDTGLSALRDIANVYETLGKFLSDLNLPSEVHFNSSACLF